MTAQSLRRSGAQQAPARRVSALSSSGFRCFEPLRECFLPCRCGRERRSGVKGRVARDWLAQPGRPMASPGTRSIRCSTSRPSSIRASAIRRRWQRHHTVSAHMTANASPALARRCSFRQRGAKSRAQQVRAVRGESGLAPAATPTPSRPQPPTCTSASAPPLVGGRAQECRSRAAPGTGAAVAGPSGSDGRRSGSRRRRRKEGGELIGRSRPVTDGSNHRPTAGGVEARVLGIVVGVEGATRRLTGEFDLSSGHVFRLVPLPFMAATVDQGCVTGVPGYLTPNLESSEWRVDPRLRCRPPARSTWCPRVSRPRRRRGRDSRPRSRPAEAT